MKAYKKNVRGSVRPRPNKDDIRYYTVTIELGRNPYTGKRERIPFRVDTIDREEAEAFLTLKKAEYIQGDLIMPNNMTVEDLMKEYLEYVKAQRSPATGRDYAEKTATYIIPEFGKMKLQKLEKGKIQQTYNRWRNAKSPASDKSLRAESIRHINRIFKAALNYAIEMEYIKKNPTNGVRIGKDLTNNRVEVYTTDEIKELKSVVKGTDMELSVALLFDCVMRRGELLGLAFEDIDFEKNIVKIRHSWVESEDSKKPVLKDCKTDGSYREMVVSEETMRLLKRQKVYCKTICLREGKPFTGKQRVICKEDGNPFLPKSYTSKWNKTLKKYGLRHIKLHGTRHSAISWFLSQGVPLHIVQARAGHQDPKITLSAYSHVAKDDASRVADLLDNTLFSAVNE